MPKKRRRSKIPTPAWDRPHGALGQRLLGQSPKFYGAAAIAALILLALGIVGFAYWSDYWEGQRRPDSTAVRVGDTKYTMRYFAQRLKMFVQQVGGVGNEQAQPTVAFPAVSELIIGESIVLMFAEEQGVSVSEEEITAEIATRLGLSDDDPTFEARFKEEISRSGLTEEEYRRMVEASVLQGKIQTELEGELPASAESVHYRQIAVSDELTADEIKLRVQAGEDFAAIAGEPANLDTQGRESGGDAGWVPRGLLEPAQEDFIFALNPQEVVTYPLPTGGAVLVIQMLEKAPDRPLDEEIKPGLAERRLVAWLREKRQGLEIVNRVDLQSGDSDDLRWLVDRVYQTGTSAVPGPLRNV